MPEFIEVPSTTTPPTPTQVQLESEKLRDLIVVDDLILPMSDDYSNIPQDVMNPITEEKVKLGKLLFHETAMTLGASEEHEATFSCASCHNARSGFKSGIAQGVGEGGVGNAIAKSSVATGELANHLDIGINGVAGTSMQAFGGQLNDVDMAAVITYQRNAFGNNMGDMVQPIDVYNHKKG